MHVRPKHLALMQDAAIVYKNFCPQNRTANNIIIERVEVYKYLGIFVNDKIKWNTHIDYLKSKLRSASYALRRLAYCSNAQILKIAYFSLAESYLRHGITAWGCSTYCEILQKSQRESLKPQKTHP